MLKIMAENNKKSELRRAEAMREAAEEFRLQKEYEAQLEREVRLTCELSSDVMYWRFSYLLLCGVAQRHSLTELESKKKHENVWDKYHFR